MIRDYGTKNRKCEKSAGGFFVLIITIIAHKCLGAWERLTEFRVVTESSRAYSYIVTEGERCREIKIDGLILRPLPWLMMYMQS